MSWILFLAGILIIFTVFLLVFSFNNQYSKKIRLILMIAGLALAIITLILVWKILCDPLFGL